MPKPSITMVLKPPEWTATHEPADNGQATISRAAAAGHIHYVTSITCTLEGIGANTLEVHFVLRDSTTGAGNILWQGKMLNLANTSAPPIALGGLNIQGVAGQAVTLETVGSPAAASSATVALTGYTRPATD